MGGNDNQNRGRKKCSIHKNGIMNQKQVTQEHGNGHCPRAKNGRWLTCNLKVSRKVGRLDQWSNDQVMFGAGCVTPHLLSCWDSQSLVHVGRESPILQLQELGGQ